MSEADKTNNEDPTNAKTADENQKQTDSSTHPICQTAKDPGKCEEFAERLGQANDNIDKHEN